MFDQAAACDEAVDLRDRARKATLVEVELCSDDELMATALVLSEARAAMDAAEGHVLAELERRGTCDRELGLSTASWLADQTHAARGPITGRLRTASQLRSSLADVDAALADGRIGFDHARAMAEAVANPRIADQVAELQDQLLAEAAACPFRVWRSELGRLVELLDQDGGYDPDRDLARNRLRLTPIGPDHLKVEGELVGETALAVGQALEAQADRVFRRFSSDHAEAADDVAVPNRATCLALGLADLCRQGTAVDPTASRLPAPDITLVLHTSAAPGPSTRSDPAVGPMVPPWVRLTTLDGQDLDLVRYEHLLCDPGFHAVLVDSLGVPLDLGRTVRLATPGQRRAIAVRDGGCVFPGCDAGPDWCDIHHVEPFGAEGTTDLANLAPQCRHHHGVTHRTGWTMVANPDQTFTWTTPSGRTIHSQRRRRPTG